MADADHIGVGELLTLTLSPSDGCRHRDDRPTCSHRFSLLCFSMIRGRGRVRARPAPRGRGRSIAPAQDSGLGNDADHEDEVAPLMDAPGVPEVVSEATASDEGDDDSHESETGIEPQHDLATGSSRHPAPPPLYQHGLFAIHQQTRHHGQTPGERSIRRSRAPDRGRGGGEPSGHDFGNHGGRSRGRPTPEHGSQAEERSGNWEDDEEETDWSAEHEYRSRRRHAPERQPMRVRSRSPPRTGRMEGSLKLAMESLDRFDINQTPNAVSWVMRFQAACTQYGLDDVYSRKLFLARVPLSWTATQQLRDDAQGVPFALVPLRDLCQRLIRDNPTDKKNLIQALTMDGQKADESAMAYARRKWADIQNAAPHLTMDECVDILEKGIHPDHEVSYGLAGIDVVDMPSFTRRLRAAMNPDNKGLKRMKEVTTRLETVETKYQALSSSLTAAPVRRGRASDPTALMLSLSPETGSVTERLASLFNASPQQANRSPRTATATVTADHGDGNTSLTERLAEILGVSPAQPSVGGSGGSEAMVPFSQAQAMGQQYLPQVECWTCGNPGHFASSCALNTRRAQSQEPQPRRPQQWSRGSFSRGSRRGQGRGSWQRGRSSFRPAPNGPDVRALPAPDADRSQGN